MEYAVVIEKAADGSYSAYVPDLPGCTSCGDSEAEIRTSIVEAIDLHVESLRYHHEEVPPPTTQVVTVVLHDQTAIEPPVDLQQARAATEYVACPDVDDPDAFAARIEGDTMAPKYAAGDIVIFSPRRPVRDGDDCFVRFTNGQTTFKRVFRGNDDASQIVRLEPRNEKYVARAVDANDISGIFRAVYRYSSVDENPVEESLLQRIRESRRIRLWETLTAE